MTPLWSWHELVQACGIEDAGEEAPAISGISIDTRTLSQGDLFIALSGDPGPRFHTSSDSSRDGHDFLVQAMEQGAGALMVNQKRSLTLTGRPMGDIPVLPVADTLDGLWDLARCARSRSQARIVAITGSAGKTTARYFIETMLDTQGETHASTASFNNHWGVPLSLARMPASSAYGVFEIGMNNPGEIVPLTELVRPQVAVVLNVLPAHLGFFENIEAIRKEKLSITAGLDSGGVLVTPSDLDIEDIVAEHQRLRSITFGLDAEADIYPLSVEKGEVWKVRARVIDEELQFSLKSGGDHRILTALASLAVLKALDGNLIQAAKSLGSIEPPAGRGNRHKIGNINLVDDSFNANPVSMGYALEALSAEKYGRKIAILGEMRELGKDSDRFHRDLAPYLSNIDAVICVGQGLEVLVDALMQQGHKKKLWGVYADISQLSLSDLVTKLRPDDCILVKGANKVFWAHDFVNKLITEINE